MTAKSLVKDECGKILERAGFRVVSPGPAQDKSAISITNALALDRVMDPIFTRNVEFMASRQVARSDNRGGRGTSLEGSAPREGSLPPPSHIPREGAPVCPPGSSTCGGNLPETT